MTPKEKAKKLYDKYCNMESWCDDAKECALIAVDEIINHHSQEQGLYRIDQYYWEQVKTEIELI
jgi:hypothetical protein